MLSSTFNVFVGKNDSGKSSLFDALVAPQPNRQHRSLTTIPTLGSPEPPASRVEIAFRLSSDEAVSFLRGYQDIYLPRTTTVNNASEALNSFLLSGGTVHATFSPEPRPYGHIDRQTQAPDKAFVHFRNEGYPREARFSTGGVISGSVDEIGPKLAAYCQAQVYAFKAERMNIGACPAQGARQLATNAANLPDVLNQLSTRNHARYEKFLAHVRTVFPHITRVSAPIDTGRSAQIMIWSTPDHLEREDLAVPLSESGTGIGQVLALLYVVVTSDNPAVIAIDEPQSFLHPGAVRKLLEILQGYPQHQYLITTHSPLAIDQLDCELFLVKREHHLSIVQRLDAQRRSDTQEFLNEVGVRLSDVFGADRVLWVEGKTEEVCFPHLLQALTGKGLNGTQILGVLSTDELTAKHTTRVVEIYERLSGGTVLLPPAVAFLFDREGRSQEEREEISRRSKDLVKWLPRRMFENYLIEPEALAERINGLDDNRPDPLTAADVKSWLEANGQDPRLGGFAPAPYPQDAWFTEIHGARLLKALFEQLTASRVTYDKVRDGAALTRWFTDEPTPSIRELVTLLRDLIDAANRQ